jgi:hypothetical protein
MSILATSGRENSGGGAMPLPSISRTCGTRQQHEVLFVVIRRVTHHHHAIELLAVGGVIGPVDLDLQRTLGHLLVEDRLRVEAAVVVADAGVVAADDQVAAAAVLAEHRVQHGLPRARHRACRSRSR